MCILHHTVGSYSFICSTLFHCNVSAMNRGNRGSVYSWLQPNSRSQYLPLIMESQLSFPLGSYHILMFQLHCIQNDQCKWPKNEAMVMDGTRSQLTLNMSPWCVLFLSPCGNMNSIMKANPRTYVSTEACINTSQDQNYLYLLVTAKIDTSRIVQSRVVPINVPTTAPTRDPDPGLAVSGNHVQCIYITYISLHKHNVC